MSTSWRIQTNLYNNTQITPTDSEIIGATVIKSYKGPKEFTFFNKGDTQGILDTFGYPSKEYPSIQDALDAVASSSLYVASPYKGGKFGGVFVTPEGTVPFVNGVATKSISSLEEIPCEVVVGIANSVLVEFEYKYASIAHIAKDSIKIFVGDTNLNVTIDDSGNITEEGGILDTGCKLDLDTGDLTLKFLIAPTEIISSTYNLDMSSSYFILYNKDMQNDDLEVKVLRSEQIDDAYDIHVLRYNPVDNEYQELTNSPYTIGLYDTSKDNYGQNIYIENIFNDNQNLFTPEVVNSIYTSFTDDVKEVPLVGGNRGSTIDGSDLANTYNALQDDNKYDLKYVFDGTASSEVATVFETLRNNYQKRCRFLTCTSDVSAQTIIQTPLTYNYGIVANRGIYEYCLNWGIHKDIYQGNDFLCSNMGLIVAKLVYMLNVGGGVPAWIAGNDGVGGELGGAITKLTQNATETELKKLDDLGFNPITMTNAYGAMIMSWRTRQLKQDVYSYIGQSSLADTLIDLVEKNVLPQRIGKLIDDTAYAEVQIGCNAILETYNRWLDDYYVLCDDRNNTDTSKNKQQLHLAISVVFKGYASRIVFNFVADRQGTNLEESLTKM